MFNSRSICGAPPGQSDTILDLAERAIQGKNFDVVKEVAIAIYDSATNEPYLYDPLLQVLRHLGRSKVHADWAPVIFDLIFSRSPTHREKVIEYKKEFDPQMAMTWKVMVNRMSREEMAAYQENSQQAKEMVALWRNQPCPDEAQAHSSALRIQGLLSKESTPKGGGFGLTPKRG